MAAITISNRTWWESQPARPERRRPRSDAPLPRPAYRVRRTVAAGLATAVLLTCGWAAGLVPAPDRVSTATPAPIVRPVAARGYVVQPGDTLWSIARAVAPEGDVRIVVDQLADLNGGAGLRVGQRLLLPDP
ncbi:MAG: LysM peptidoglycan-binding domain-containing protein [Acidimicrobiales bacterium]